MRKSNKPNNENKQRVRVLETGQLGTVTDQQLIPRKGKLHRYMQVRLDGRPHLDRWFWDDQLGKAIEEVRLTIEDGRGNRWTIGIKVDYDQKYQQLSMQGATQNKIYPKDYSVLLTRMLLEVLGVNPSDFEEHLMEGR